MKKWETRESESPTPRMKNKMQLQMTRSSPCDAIHRSLRVPPRQPASALRSRNGLRPRLWIAAALKPDQRVLVLNAGSSSLKFKTYQLGGAGGLTLIPGMGGIIERIGDEANSGLVAKGINTSGQPQKWDMKVPARSVLMSKSECLPIPSSLFIVRLCTPMLS